MATGTTKKTQAIGLSDTKKTELLLAGLNECDRALRLVSVLRDLLPEGHPHHRLAELAHGDLAAGVDELGLALDVEVVR